jgi:hypothetical protein
MCPMTRYPMSQSLLSPFRRSQQKTLALVLAALAEVAEVPPAIRLQCQQQGLRLSLVRVGQWCLPMLARRVYLGGYFIRVHLPPAQIRQFPWLQPWEVLG